MRVCNYVYAATCPAPVLPYEVERYEGMRLMFCLPLAELDDDAQTYLVVITAAATYCRVSDSIFDLINDIYRHRPGNHRCISCCRVGTYYSGGDASA